MIGDVGVSVNFPALMHLLEVSDYVVKLSSIGAGEGIDEFRKRLISELEIEVDARFHSIINKISLYHRFHSIIDKILYDSCRIRTCAGIQR